MMTVFGAMFLVGAAMAVAGYHGKYNANCEDIANDN